ncbi:MULTISPECIES: ABC transporter permease subunit [unclassified Pseudomonas]|uniref:ABC transporter permease n=1 Tax=unclassified Pseudomonas TaxID=196821 RepID=UPI000BCA792C|nr:MULTISPECIES: ABC transporter permease subunit [unclassified Pseudomonas]PVZ20510.1 NitT/TauT family transport system permease protein [Pseudomonas sp. URIL14HWK12:I12]PVZ27576.1 NitT/TauT family transport system permease protein [Pseudomonas sp. URIL14HWK12:I10]PVZ38465.1 NitT/TauT family transport system permease protein [Pseudomonas sp. URIL14HWK12:I11]SNZ03250.1 NitT/TauT family transport system permease protein [Pseudomonas sp. URIL14HWK12:I9]
MAPFFSFSQRPRGTAPNRWDWFLLPLVLGLLVLAAYGAAQMSRPFVVGEPLPISLDPWQLPYYLLRTMLRMFTALGVSLLFAFAFAALAAKYRAAEKALIPLLDVLQSVPILGFQAIAIAPFIALFPGNLLGVECAAVFAIFTSQAWNMALSLYQSFRTVPAELSEAARVFRLSGWQRFWRLELPFAMPGLLWNMMMSMSGGWFFLVAAEAISVAGQDIKLPGIGSYIAVAIDQRALGAIGWAIAAMLAGILIYDQLFFRPLLAWADRFRFEDAQGETAQRSWLLEWGRRSRWLSAASAWLSAGAQRAMGAFPARHDGLHVPRRQWQLPQWWPRAWDGLLLMLCLAIFVELGLFIHQTVGWAEAVHVMGLGLVTLARVMVLIALASLVWVPLSIWIGLRPRYSQKVQALAQFLAAFPVNLLFPLVVVGLVHFDLSPNLWLSPLMVFGTQWYILFNVVAGAATIPFELRLAADNLGLRGWLKWKRVYLPAVFPSFVTGAITASGGSWNASIVAEYVTWGDTTLQATGLGSYIKQMTDAGDFHRIALGIGVMCIYVMLLNRFFWRRLYLRAESRR